ncbi:MAG: hypothetical protein RL670_935 [Actinomycetota bacterium]|jgi:peptidoglycan/LPS O-acetylase OafA/YrhL
MSTAHRPRDYRPEIDGLRALAVIPVVIYHLTTGGSRIDLLPGGFLGVDVFFVISGYLITRILLSKHDQPIGQTLKGFWGGRLRRIFPLLAVVTFVTTLAAWFIFSPKAIREYLGSAFAALFSYSNLFFWTEDSYIAEASSVKPLMHTWSLAVEEQFYLVYPLLLLAMLRYLKRPVIGLWVLLLLSLNACLIASAVDSSFNFFSFTSRGWELAAGALVAIVPRRNNGYLAWLGLGLIGVGYLVVKDTYWHPSPTWTLLPVVGTALVIWFGSPENSAGRALAWRPLVGIGLISFGIYLWHWPIMAFVNYLDLSGGAAAKLIQIAAALVLAVISYYLVERPFRNRSLMPAKPLAGWLSGLAGATVALLIFTSVNTGSAFRLGETMAKSYQSFERSDLNAICRVADDSALFEKGLCRIGAEKAEPDFVLFGDSHALSLLHAFDQQAALANRAGYFSYQSGCPPLLGIYVERKPEQTKRCHELNRRIAKTLEGGQIRSLFLVARWNYYWDDPESLRLATTERGFGGDETKLFSAALETTLKHYSPLVEEQVVFEDTPAQKLKPDAAFKSGKPLDSLSVSASDYQARNQRFTDLLGKLGPPANLKLFNPAPFVCGPKVCPIGKGKISYFFDDDHLSVVGAERLNQPIADLLRTRG